MDLFNLYENIGSRKLIIFGTGRFADSYLDVIGPSHEVAFFVDNNTKVWGQKKDGIEVCSPMRLQEVSSKEYRVIIAIKDYDPIVTQVLDLGFPMEQVKVYSRLMEELYPLRITDTIHSGKYDVGYVTGAFDLFHIGHLNILKNSKSRCHHLIAGVLTDQIIIQDKFKEPFIPFEERLEIVRQCKYVDDVIAIDLHNTNKVDAWRELRYGCLFCGSDHYGAPYWMNLQKELQHLGSNLEFFPYTESTSSTMLQELIRRQIEG